MDEDLDKVFNPNDTVIDIVAKFINNPNILKNYVKLLEKTKIKLENMKKEMIEKKKKKEQENK